MKAPHFFAVLAIYCAAAGGAKAQQSILVPWNHLWDFMHPMGAMPNVPPGGDSDFDSTWYLSAAEFAARYNGPIFGSVPELAGDPLVTGSYDSGYAEGPLGYGDAAYFGDAAAEFTAFGDDDGDAGNGLAGELTTPASGQRRAAYFRTTFTVPAGGGPLVRPVIRCLIDDGAYVYLDGELVAAINMANTTPPNRDTYATVNAANTTATESDLRLIELSLPDGSATGTAPGNAALAENSRIVKQVTGLSVGEHTLAVSARSNSQTSSDILMAFELSAEVGCLIAAESGNVVRSDAGTPLDASDDTFTFDVTVSGFGGGASWSSPVPGGAARPYGVPVTLGPFAVAQSPVTVTVTAASDPACTAEATATAPGGSISATATAFVRDQRGTVDPGDDTFTASVTVGSQFASNRWTATATSPFQSSLGTPASGGYGVPVQFGPYALTAGPITIDLADRIDPALTAQVVLSAPVFIGGKSFAGTPTSLLSAQPLPAQWASNGATPPTITMADAGGDVWREFRSERLDLSAVGAVGFSAELIARETSTGSNFEAGDAFRARLLLTGAGVPASIDLTAAFDANADGLLSGTDSDPYDPALDEFNRTRQPVDALLNHVLPLAALVPAGADSVQLVVEAKGIGASEFFDVRKIAFNDGCTFQLAVTDPFRNSNGQPRNPAAHTVEFVLHATPAGLVSPLGWNVAFTRGGSPVAGASITGGAYNAAVAVAGLPALGGPITVTLTDRIDPTCTASVLVAVPGPPSIVGTVEIGAGPGDLFSAGEAGRWTAIAGGLEMAQAAALSAFATEWVDLSAVNGNVYFSMALQAMETSTGSNFEADDTFLAELLLDDGVSIVALNLTTAYDRNGNGRMNGAGAVANDEFNTAAQPASALLDNSFAFSAVVPGQIRRVALRIEAQVDAGSEFLRLSDVRFTTTPPIGGADSDGDGVSDEDEAAAGTDPADPTSVLRLTALAGVAPGDFEARFPTNAGRFYQGYLSADLVTWTRDDSRAAITGDGNPAAWPFAGAGQPRRFLAVAVAADPGSFPATLP